MTSPSTVTPSTCAKTPVNCRVETAVAIEVDDADKASTLHVWALGVLTVIGGQFYGWNEALSTGFVPYFVSQVLMGLAFITYMASASEVCSKIQFSGGAYGLARVTLGFYTGFLVGFLELLEYITYTSVSVLFMSDFLTSRYGVEKAWEPLLWAIYYVATTSLILLRGKHFWRFCCILAAACVLPPLVFCFSSLRHTDLGRNGPLTIANSSVLNVWATGDLSSAYFAWLPYTTWAYAGVECLTLVTSITKDAKTSMPRGMMAATYTLFVFNLALVCIVSALPPGLATTASAAFPLNIGFQLGLQMSSHAASWLIMPGQLGMAFGFMMPCARLAQALADSNLLPPRFGIKGQSTLGRALVLTSTSGYLICLVSFYSPLFLSALQNISILAAVLCYGAQIGGFVLLRTRYRTETTGYVSPFGMVGAVYACLIYTLLGISIVGGFQDDNNVAFGSLVAFLMVLSAYYRFVCQKIQSISKDEYSSIFRFSVMKFNAARKKTHGATKVTHVSANGPKTNGCSVGNGGSSRTVWLGTPARGSSITSIAVQAAKGENSRSKE